MQSLKWAFWLGHWKDCLWSLGALRTWLCLPKIVVTPKQVRWSDFDEINFIFHVKTSIMKKYGWAFCWHTLYMYLQILQFYYIEKCNYKQSKVIWVKTYVDLRSEATRSIPGRWPVPLELITVSVGFLPITSYITSKFHIFSFLPTGWINIFWLFFYLIYSNSFHFNMSCLRNLKF
jgi:hypothetical protein